MNTEKAIEFLKNEINGDNYKAIEGIIELLQNRKRKPYERLEKFLQETYKYYSVEGAWAYNEGYLDSLVDNTEHFKHGELCKLVEMNSKMKEGKI